MGKYSLVLCLFFSFSFLFWCSASFLLWYHPQLKGVFLPQSNISGNTLTDPTRQYFLGDSQSSQVGSGDSPSQLGNTSLHDTFILVLCVCLSFFMWGVGPHTCPCTCVWWPGDNLMGNPQELHLPSLRQGLSLTWSSAIRLDWQTSKPQGSSCSHLLSAGIKSTHYHTLHFFHDSHDWTRVLMPARQALNWQSYRLSLIFIPELFKNLLAAYKDLSSEVVRLPSR